MDQGATLYGGNGPGQIVLDGDPTPQRGTTLQFSAHVCCDHTAEWIKRPLGTEVDLGLGHIVLDGDPDPAPLTGRGTAAHIFGPCLFRPNGRPSQLVPSSC